MNIMPCTYSIQNQHCTIEKSCCTTLALYPNGLFAGITISHITLLQLTHAWHSAKAEVQHEVLLEDAADGRRGAEDGGAALEFNSLVLGRWTCDQSNLVQLDFQDQYRSTLMLLC